MHELFSSGHVIDLVIAILALEALLLKGWLRHRRTLPWPTLMAGLGLLLSWRVAQAGAPWFWVAVPLAAAGLAHALDVWSHWSDT
jgi:hypothetical protein